MAQYSYSRDLNPSAPPAPVIHIRVTRPDSSFWLTLVAKVDSGADMTILPARVIAELRLPQVGLIPMGAAFDDKPSERPVFAVELATEFAPPEIAEVAGFNKGYALLGRDFLNRWKVSLDGPKGLLEIAV